MVLIAWAAAVAACRHAPRNGPADEACGPCDPVLLLTEASADDRPPLRRFDRVIVSTCRGAQLADSTRKRWHHDACWAKTAHYLANSLDWAGDLQASWERETHDTFACPREELDAGACGLAVTPPFIVGPLDMEQSRANPAVAMLVRSDELRSAGAAEPVEDLVASIEAGRTGNSCRPPRWIYEGACSAFLVARDLVLTARHCVGDYPAICGGHEDQGARRPGLRLVFDYDAGSSEGLVAGGLEVLDCGQRSEDREDWALLKFTPPWTSPRRPFVLPDRAPDVCDDVLVLGHPLGHPQHRSGSTDAASPSAWVVARNAGTFSAGLDSVWGFSGGPVLAAEDQRLLGLFVSGRYQKSTTDGCDWLFQCGAAGCPNPSDYAVAVDLSVLGPRLAPHIALPR